MKSAETHPTPPGVLAAIDTVATWLRVIEAAECHIRPNGGAAFKLETHTDEIGRRLEEIVRLGTTLETLCGILEDAEPHATCNCSGCAAVVAARAALEVHNGNA